MVQVQARKELCHRLRRLLIKLAAHFTTVVRWCLPETRKGKEEKRGIAPLVGEDGFEPSQPEGARFTVWSN